MLHRYFCGDFLFLQNLIHSSLQTAWNLRKNNFNPNLSKFKMFGGSSASIENPYNLLICSFKQTKYPSFDCLKKITIRESWKNKFIIKTREKVNFRVQCSARIHETFETCPIETSQREEDSYRKISEVEFCGFGHRTSKRKFR